MLKFPTRAFKENRLLLSSEELEEKAAECHAVGKSCEIGLYSFTEWLNGEPVIESAIIDKIVLKGEQSTLEKIADKKLEAQIESVLIFDGETYLLLIDESKDNIEELANETYVGTTTITDVLKKITIPNYPNLKTGQMSKIIKRRRLND